MPSKARRPPSGSGMGGPFDPGPYKEIRGDAPGEDDDLRTSLFSTTVAAGYNEGSPFSTPVATGNNEGGVANKDAHFVQILSVIVLR